MSDVDQDEAERSIAKFRGQELLDQLREAKRRYETGEHGGREGVAMAINVIVNCLRKDPMIRAEGLVTPLVGLSAALAELADGVVPALLKPAQRGGGRAPAGLPHAALRAATTFVVERLIECGMRKGQAEKAVAKKLATLGVRPLRGQARRVSAQTIREWRDAIRSDAKAETDARKIFDNWTATLPRHLKSVPLAQIQRELLDTLADLVREHRLAG